MNQAMNFLISKMLNTICGFHADLKLKYFKSLKFKI